MLRCLRIYSGYHGPSRTRLKRLPQFTDITMFKSGYEKSSEISFTKTTFIFPNRSLRNTTISPASSPSTPLYIVETPTGIFRPDPPNTIYKVGRDGRKEHYATLNWKGFGNDTIMFAGQAQSQITRAVLPKRGWCRKRIQRGATGDWTWKGHCRPELFNATNQSIAKYDKYYRSSAPAPATLVVDSEAMSSLDMVILALLVVRQDMRRRRRRQAAA